MDGKIRNGCCGILCGKIKNLLFPGFQFWVSGCAAMGDFYETEEHIWWGFFFQGGDVGKLCNPSLRACFPSGREVISERKIIP